MGKLKKKLEEEKKLLEKELSTIGRKSGDVSGDWEAVPPETESSPESDKNLAADMMEGFEESYATEGELEQRLSSINEALEKMKSDSYGKCRICGKEIETEKLNANPAADTCVEHKDSL